MSGRDCFASRFFSGIDCLLKLHAWLIYAAN
jgi:hypothetical protein